jgi:GNAT superfamily N-acetyltransferase
VSLTDTDIDPDAQPATIERLDPATYEASIPALAELLKDAVDGGAGVNFLAGVTTAETAGWWRERVALVADGTITPIVARDPEGRIVGSTLLIRSRNQNSMHRAEIGKVIVHRRARRQGIGRRLMEAAEAEARADRRWLLILDTVSGSAADALYRATGWQVLGTMPDHGRLPTGELRPTTYFWKDLR